jgi:hypothetical protein
MLTKISRKSVLLSSMSQIYGLLIGRSYQSHQRYAYFWERNEEIKHDYGYYSSYYLQENIEGVTT